MKRSRLSLPPRRKDRATERENRGATGNAGPINDDDLPSSASGLPSPSRQRPSAPRGATPTRPLKSNAPQQPPSPLPQSPWAISSRKRPLPSPSASSPQQQHDTGVIDLTADDGNSCEVKVPATVTAAAAATAAAAPLVVAAETPCAKTPLPPTSPPTPTTPLPPTSMRSSEDTDCERPRSIYLQHFEDTIETVMRARPDYASLFTPEEREVAQRFARLSRAAKSLYVRLFQRKGPWFRVDGMLGYDEIGSGKPLWLRRQEAAAAATAALTAGGHSLVGVDCQGRDKLSATVPASPFAPPSSEGASQADGLEERSTAGCSAGNGLDAPRTESVAGLGKKGKEDERQEGALPMSNAEEPVLSSEYEAEATAAAAAASVALTPQELTALHGKIQAALLELLEAELLKALPSDVYGSGSSLKATLASVECCLRSPEIKTLLKRTGGGKAKARSHGSKSTGRGSLPWRGRKGYGVSEAEAGPTGSTAEGGGRRAMTEELRRRLAGQQTLWGVKLPLVREIERLVSASLGRVGVDVAGGTTCGGDGDSVEDGFSTKHRRKTQRFHGLVLVADDPRLVFKRALRLMYLTCNTGALSSGRVGAASVRGAGAAGAMSSWSPGLAVAFGKTRYAPYICNTRTRVFQGREDFLRWEAAVELRCALDSAMDKLSRGKPEAAAAAGMVESDEDDIEASNDSLDRVPEVIVLDLDEVTDDDGVVDFKLKCEEEGRPEAEDDIRAAMDGLEESVARFLPKVEGQTVAASTSTAITLALVCARCLYAHLGASPAVLKTSVAAAGATRDKQSKEGEEEFIFLLRKACRGSDMVGFGRKSDAAITADKVDEEGGDRERGAVSCSAAECARTLVSEPVRENEGLSSQRMPRGDVCETYPLQRLHEEDVESGEGFHAEGGCTASNSLLQGNAGDQTPEFLFQLDAGWVLASAVWEGVALLERARDYEGAVELLAQLLATRYTSHRRGRWWNRLSLDLAHTGRLKCALWAAQEGVEDRQVRGGDRITLEKRTHMLTTRVSNKSINLKGEPRASAGVASSHERTRVPSGADSSEPAPRLAAAPSSDTSALRACAFGLDEEGDASDGDIGDLFEDPAVERERRRKKKRRQKRRRLQAKSLAKAGICADVGANEEGAGGDRGSSDSLTGGAESSPTIPVTNSASSSLASCDVTSIQARRADGANFSGATVRGGVLYKNQEVSGGGIDGGGGGASGHGSPVPSVPVATSCQGTLGCEGLAELAQVPYTIKEESIGVVVFAETIAASTVEGRAGHGGGKGVGVAEMSITGRRLNREIGVKSRFVGYGDGAACSVESLVLQHLSQQEEGGWAGWHCEGSPVRGLWALLMWDVLFMDVPDVFQTPFQDAPLDLDFCPLFYLNRREAVDARLAEIRVAPTAALVALVGEAWVANSNTVCRGLHWDRTSVRYLQAVAAGLGGRAVAAALAALCLNHKHFGGGLPDLLLMRAVRTGIIDGSADGASKKGIVEDANKPEVSTPQRFVSWLGVETGAFHEGRAPVEATRGGSQIGGSGRSSSPSPSPPPPPLEPGDIAGLRVETWLLEVKGPSDRLSDRQTAWLGILDRGGARVGVCHVVEGSGGSHVARAAEVTKK